MYTLGDGDEDRRSLAVEKLMQVAPLANERFHLLAGRQRQHSSNVDQNYILCHHLLAHSPRTKDVSAAASLLPLLLKRPHSTNQ